MLTSDDLRLINRLPQVEIRSVPMVFTSMCLATARSGILRCRFWLLGKIGIQIISRTATMPATFLCFFPITAKLQCTFLPIALESGKSLAVRCLFTETPMTIERSPEETQAAG